MGFTFTRSTRTPTPGWSGVRIMAKNWFFTEAHWRAAGFSRKAGGGAELMKPALASSSREHGLDF